MCKKSDPQSSWTVTLEENEEMIESLIWSQEENKFTSVVHLWKEW